MTEKPKAPCEKLIELLFIRHALHICGPQTALYAPSSHDEYVQGYDAKLIGRDGCRELYLQFKTPRLIKDGGFTVTINTHQHSRLQKLYQPGSAFYVSHTFRSIREVQDYQLRVTDSSEFLKYFIVVEAHELPSDTDFFQFARNTTNFPRQPRYKHEAEGLIKKANNVVRLGHWCNGTKILEKYNENSAGHRMDFADAFAKLQEFEQGKSDLPRHRAEATLAGRWAGSEEDSSFGFILRNYDKQG